MRPAQWGTYPNFQQGEFSCKHTGQNAMAHVFMERLQNARTLYGRPMVITSGFRAVSHPVEAAKPKPGTHSHGLASDIRYRNADEFGALITALHAAGFRRFGIAKTFIHVDSGELIGMRQAVWTY